MCVLPGGLPVKCLGEGYSRRCIPAFCSAGACEQRASGQRACRLLRGIERPGEISFFAGCHLEVNHWCHEKAVYKPSDARTKLSFGNGTYRHGRCGEESTLLVAALRSVGIPARQVYTPRWAHTDDNHAWVEAWADGKWYFLGACEPEPVLNLGWFNAPASRGMLMHTKSVRAL